MPVTPRLPKEPGMRRSGRDRKYSHTHMSIYSRRALLGAATLSATAVLLSYGITGPRPDGDHESVPPRTPPSTLVETRWVRRGGGSGAPAPPAPAGRFGRRGLRAPASRRTSAPPRVAAAASSADAALPGPRGHDPGLPKGSAERRSVTFGQVDNACSAAWLDGKHAAHALDLPAPIRQLRFPCPPPSRYPKRLPWNARASASAHGATTAAARSCCGSWPSCWRFARGR